MRRVSVLLVLGVVGVVLGAQTAAPAAVSESFFAEGDASAGWVHYSPPPPGSSEDFSIALYAAGSFSTYDFSGVELNGVPSSAPSTPPSFLFLSTVSYASTGSPRLHMEFSDGGEIFVMPYGWTGAWTLVPSGPNDFRNVGGTCGDLISVTYATALACHTGASVTRVYIVTDMGRYFGSYTHYIDDIKYGDTTISYPTSCIQDRTGSYENGLISGPVHAVVEPLTGPLEPEVHQFNCVVIVDLGL